MKTVGIIGLRGHAKKLRDILEPIASVTQLYHPSSKIDDPRCTQEFIDLMECDAIVIASPNHTHMGYLMRLKGFGGHIFCEKPPVTRNDDVSILRSFGPESKRLFFNFTYRRSALADALEMMDIGEPVAFSAKVCHGLAFKPGYSETWRADKEKHGLGVIETLGIHFIDLALFMWKRFGVELVDASHVSAVIAKTGTAYDTSRVSLTMANGATGDILVSYAAPYEFDVEVICTDGILTMRDDRIDIRSPRDTFDTLGLFSRPKVSTRIEIDTETMYVDALSRSVKHFMNVVEANGHFSTVEYEASLELCQVLSEFK